MHLYRAIDSNGDTVEFWYSERRNLAAAKRYLRKALKRHGRPERIVIDGVKRRMQASPDQTYRNCRESSFPTPSRPLREGSSRKGNASDKSPGGHTAARPASHGAIRS